MLTLIRGKIINKKVLNLCLLVGILMFVLVAATTPMFEKGSLRRLLMSEFDEYIVANNEQPFIMSRSEKLEMENGIDAELVEKIADEYADLWEKYLPAKESGRQIILSLPDVSIKRQFANETSFAGVEYIKDLDSHIQIVAGENALNRGDFSCIISEKVYDDENLTLGEEVTFSNIKNNNGESLKLKVAGVYCEKDLSDPFLLRDESELRSKFYVSNDTFNKICSEYSIGEITIGTYVAIDYMSIMCEDIDEIKRCLDTYTKEDTLFNTNVSETIKNYIKGRKEIKTMSLVLELPVFALLMFFIYMVTSQLIGTESGEIAIYKSRGFFSTKIIGIYLGQALIITLSAIVIALPLAYFLCLLVAKADGFMSFNNILTDVYRFEPLMIVYALIAGIISIIVILIPVIGCLSSTVISARNKKIGNMKKGIVHRFYIDIILCIVFSYLSYNYSKQTQLLANAVISGEGIDGMMFLSVSLLILSLALISIRITGYIVSLIYTSFKNKWKPNMYASFLELRRSNRKRDFISLFIVFTVAMSIFEANLAVTVNKMNEERIVYNDGADMIVKEHWTPEKRMDSVTRSTVRVYVEPDFGRFEELKSRGVKMTRVINADATIALNNNFNTKTGLMSIHTKEFGETANSIGRLNGEHYFNYLNALAKERDGVLISKSLASENDINVGDSITYVRQKETEGKSEGAKIYKTGKVVGIFDSFPGYEKYKYEYDKDMKMTERINNLIVTNYASEVSSFGITPYEVWMDLNDASVDESFIRDFISKKGIDISFDRSVKEDVINKKSESIVLITNGLFSLSFIVSLITCMIGMMIYWITSFREREMMFSIYRAMGMSAKSVSAIIVNEQIFASVFAWINGGIIGVIVSKFLVELLATVYLPYKHNIPLRMITDVKDSVMLMSIVFAVILFCIAFLRRLMKRSNMVKAIKMGED